MPQIQANKDFCKLITTLEVDKEVAKKLDFTPLTGDLSGLRRRAKLNAKVSLEIDNKDKVGQKTAMSLGS